MKKSLAALLVPCALALALPAAALAAPDEGPGTIAVVPEPLVVPTTTVGDQGEWLAVDVSYKGDGEAAIEKLSLLGEQAGEFSSTGSDCGVLVNGQHCTAWFALKPSSEGDKEATLEIRFQGDRPTEKRSISGRAALPQLSFSPSEYDYGMQRVNRESAGASFQLTNKGEAPVMPSSFEIGGDSESFWTGSNSCWNTWLAPGDSCAVEVWFGPRERRDYAAELRVWANGFAFTAALAGRGGQAIIGPTENPVGFGTATLGSAGTTKTVTLTNSGDMSAAFFIAVIAGGDAGSFELVEENCSMVELLPGASCEATVRFQPRSAGAKSARLAFFGDGDDGTLIFLEGEGTAADLTLLPASHDFGAEAVGSRGAAQSFAVRNRSDGPLELDTVGLVGTAPDQFLIGGDECSGAILAPGEQCLVRVRFAPDRAGAAAATLRVRGEFGTLRSALQGDGVASPAVVVQPAAGTASAASSASAGTDYQVAPAPRKARGKRFARNQTIRGPKRDPGARRSSAHKRLGSRR